MSLGNPASVRGCLRIVRVAFETSSTDVEHGLADLMGVTGAYWGAWSYELKMYQLFDLDYDDADDDSDDTVLNQMEDWLLHQLPPAERKKRPRQRL
jgi:hypothetical protein